MAEKSQIFMYFGLAADTIGFPSTYVQVKDQPLFALFYQNFNFGILGVCLMEKMYNIDGNEH